MLFAGFLQYLHITRWWNYIATLSLLRLDNEGGYVISRSIRGIEHVVNIFSTLQVTAGILQAKAAAIAIGIGHMYDIGHERSKTVVVVVTGG
jgi:hypothetical protein